MTLGFTKGCFQKGAAAAVFAAVVTGSSMASAVNFSGSYDINALSSDPGLVIATHKLADPLNFALNSPGAMYTIDLFDIWTDETAINSDDEMHAGISVDFDFFAPPTAGSVTGTTFGGSVLIFSGGKVEWNGPQVLDFGNQGQLQISLSDETFNVGVFGNTAPGQKHGATVKAKFTLVSDSVAVPLPASLPLFMAALGSLAVLRRRTRVAA